MLRSLLSGLIRRRWALAAVMLAGGAWSGPASAAPEEQLVNGSFDAGSAAWLASDDLVLTTDAGRLCTEVPSVSGSPFSTVVGQLDLEMLAGESYRLSITASAAPAPQFIYALIQGDLEPFDVFTFQVVSL